MTRWRATRARGGTSWHCRGSYWAITSVRASGYATCAPAGHGHGRAWMRRWLAAADERACGADRDALRTELVQHFGHALVTAQADVYARAAELNGGGGLTAPRRAALRPEGQRLLLATRVHGAAGRNARA